MCLNGLTEAISFYNGICHKHQENWRAEVQLQHQSPQPKLKGDLGISIKFPSFLPVETGPHVTQAGLKLGVAEDDLTLLGLLVSTPQGGKTPRPVLHAHFIQRGTEPRAAGM